MNISNLGRLIGAGLLALGLQALVPEASEPPAPATGNTGMATPASAATNDQRG